MIGPSRTRTAATSIRSALRLAAWFATLKLLLTFALTLYTQHIGYGYFRDEFYYIACGRHLAWGYVDHGPVVAVQARLGELLFGDSLFAIRIFSALAGAVTIFLAGLLAWALDGRRPAQALAMFGLVCCPQFIGTDGFLSMNSFEPVFWMTCALAVILLVEGHSAARWWTIFGVAAGVGLLNKPSMTFFLVALGLALLLTPERRILFTQYAALGVALLILIASPNLIWQIHNHWPTLEFLRNGQLHHKNVVLDPLHFFLAQFGNMQPVNALLWITGLVALLRSRSIRNARWLGLCFILFYGLMESLHAKDYYLAPIYPVLFAAGAVAWERHFAGSRQVREDRIIAFPVFEAVLLVTTLVLLPMASPVLPPAQWVAYTSALHLRSAKTENAATSDLPQFYADRFAWQEMSNAVVATYRSLSPADRAQVCIVGDNYGDAGAIDFLGRRAEPGLPAAISHHNNYWIWGLHGCTGKVVIDITGDDATDIDGYYRSVQLITHLNVQHSMPQEHKNIYLLRDRRPDSITWEKDFF